MGKLPNRPNCGNGLTTAKSAGADFNFVPKTSDRWCPSTARTKDSATEIGQSLDIPDKLESGATLDLLDSVMTQVETDKASSYMEL
ncbi:hypothetical protein [Chamaesiphon sp.]|uniref:hypothetical protein n=1 Tax=Chamaesiphon sp. TaxID=2814140 RepID=UPI0035949036